MDAILYKKFESWPEPVKPPFADIQIIGCCEEHEQAGQFVWYRNHSWQDLRDLILSKDQIIEKEIDPSTFRSMDPRVQHYYLKGALCALAKKADEAGSFEEIDFVIWQWIVRHKTDLEKLADSNGQNLEFSKEEVSDMIALVGQLKARSAAGNHMKKDLASTLDFWQEVHKRLSK